MEKETLIRPSLLSSSFLHLEDDVKEMIALGVTSCHYDVMDGAFVHDITYGEPIYKKLYERFNKDIAFDVHLMVKNPLLHVESFASIGAKEITYHFEEMKKEDLKIIDELRERFPNLRIGIAINPSTSVDSIYDILKYYDSVLVMSVVPGKGGQGFIEKSDEKIRLLDKYRKENHLSYTIGVDGGINETTGPLCIKANVDYMVAGSYYFKATDKKQAILKAKGLL